MVKYRFEHWEDPNLINPTRVIDLKTNMEVTAYYKEVSEVAIVTFAGTVSAQAAAGQAITITVTKPDATTEPVTTKTLEDLTFSVDYENVPGSYKAKARIEEDELYQAAESDEVPFSIGKEPRTITLTVTPK